MTASENLIESSTPMRIGMKPENKAHLPASNILMAAQRFIADAEALQEILVVAKPVLIAKQDERKAELDELMSQTQKASDAGIRPDLLELNRAAGLFSKQRRGGFLFRGHLLVALVSRFDTFASEVARELLRAFPDRLGEKSVSFSDASKFGSIEELKKKIIDEKIDAEMRDSHIKQLKFLSSLANVPLGTDEPQLLSKFVEITERRNCHIHANGRVSPQYREVCEQNHVCFEKTPCDGDNLNVTVDYFEKACRVLGEMAFKIAQTIVRKTFDKSMGLADIFLDAIGIELLNTHRWTDALMVYDFATALRGTSAGDECFKKNSIINKAQALIGLGKYDEAMKKIELTDWSASHPRYVMAIHILKYEFSDAAKLIPVAEIKEDMYRKWPIFHAFRETEEFRDAFSSHFGHDFNAASFGAVSKEIAEMEIDDPALTPCRNVDSEDEHGDPQKD